MTAGEFMPQEAVDEAEEAALEAYLGRYFGAVAGGDPPTEAERLADLAGPAVAHMTDGEAVDRWVARRYPGGSA
jgi:hypothetical protein